MEHCWFMELVDGTRIPFTYSYDDSNNPLVSISGFEQDGHYLIQYPMDTIGPSGGPLLEGMNHHPLASGVISEEMCCWAIPKANVYRTYSESTL